MKDFKIQSTLILEEIKKAQRLLLHLHPSPDPDSVGSALAFYQVLKNMGKEAVVIAGDSPLPQSLSFLPCFNEIEEKNFFEIDQSAFDLFIVLDSSNEGMISKQEKVVFPEGMKTVVIDHHVSNSAYGDINLIDGNAPATAEILFHLFEDWKIEITPDIAVCLFIGLYGDTGGFRYPQTTSQTFLIASRLVDIYPRFSAVLSLMNSQNTPGQLTYRSLAYSQIEVVGAGKIALVALGYDIIKEKDFTEEDMSNAQIPNNLITVKDWVMGISLVEKKEGQVFLSIRCRDSHIDASRLATSLGGGGHAGAAGAMIEGSFVEIKTRVLQLLAEFFPELF